TANVELVGLRGQAVLVTWRIYQAGGTTALFGKWLGTTAAYRLVAGTDDDTTAFDLWVPLPNVPGQYTVNLSLTANGANLASEDSPPFK
ncbi:MAG TPA: hypothetical protein VF317_06600, partial [Dermatophilaceae bacterium]